MNTLTETVSKYGWTVKENTGIITLHNRKGVPVVDIKTKGDKYTIFEQGTANKLMSGKGQMEQSVEKLMVQYYYCQPLQTA